MSNNEWPLAFPASYFYEVHPRSLASVVITSLFNKLGSSNYTINRLTRYNMHICANKIMYVNYPIQNQEDFECKGVGNAGGNNA